VYSLGLTGGFDFPTRGGAPAFTLGLLSISRFNEIDKRRIQKFLDSPRGSSFIQKQIGLQMSNPKTEVDTTSFGGGLGGGAFGPLQITRVYTSSNTLEQVGVQGSGAHGIRHGLVAFPAGEDKNYYNTVKKQITLSLSGDNESAKADNRLLLLYSTKMKTDNRISPSDYGTNIEKINNLGISRNKDVLFQYLGGPGSTYGMGDTIIRRFVDTTKVISTRVMTYDLLMQQKINIENRSQKTTKFNIQDFRKQSNPNGNYVPWDPESVRVKYGKVVSSNSTEGYEQAKQKGDRLIKEQDTNLGKLGYGSEAKLQDFRSGSFSAAWNNEESVDYRFYSRYDQGSRKGRVDKINASYPYVFKNDSAPWSGNSNANDLIKFVFEAIDNDNPTQSIAIFFRAFLAGNITDNNTGAWNGFKYFGRGEDFFTYQGFTRSISFGFTVVAQSQYELQPMYNRLNALISQVYPDYSRDGIMRAPIIRLTVGDYIYRMAGFLDNVNVTLDTSAAWQTEDNRQFPNKADVSIGFKPIPEDLPRRYSTSQGISRLIAQGGNSADPFIKGIYTNYTDAFAFPTSSI
jgi:hypothetical protein